MDDLNSRFSICFVERIVDMKKGDSNKTTRKVISRTTSRTPSVAPNSDDNSQTPKNTNTGTNSKRMSKRKRYRAKDRRLGMGEVTNHKTNNQNTAGSKTITSPRTTVYPTPFRTESSHENNKIVTAQENSIKTVAINELIFVVFEYLAEIIKANGMMHNNNTSQNPSELVAKTVLRP